MISRSIWVIISLGMCSRPVPYTPGYYREKSLSGYPKKFWTQDLIDIKKS